MKPLNLYLVIRPAAWGYDQYHEFIAAAKTPQAAKKIHPAGPRYKWSQTKNAWVEHLSNGQTRLEEHPSVWPVKPKDLKAKLVGTAKEGTKPGVILGSFNAG